MNQIRIILVAVFIAIVFLSEDLVFSQVSDEPKTKDPGALVEKPITKETYRKAAKQISYWEGFYPCPKSDPVGHATIGYGYLLHYGPPTERDFAKWGCISEKEGRRLLAKDLPRYDLESVLSEYSIALPKSQGKQIALISFIYNLGVHVLDQGTGLRTALQEEHGIASQIKRYVYASDGEKMIKLPGLIRRRNWEASFFTNAQ